MTETHDDAVEAAHVNCGVPLSVFKSLDAMTDQQRKAVFEAYCTHCGSAEPGCQCWNDE